MNVIFRSIVIAVLAACLIAQAAFAQGFKYLEVKVVDPDGKPMADVPVEIDISNMKFPMPTDGEGMVSINVPDGVENELTLRVHQPGYVALLARWSKGNKIPEKFTFPLKKGSVIGGIVHDELGQPIAGVKVEAYVSDSLDDDINAGKGELLPSLRGEIGVTDNEGRWLCDTAPDKDMQMQLHFSHPDYVDDGSYSFRGGTWEELLSHEKIVVLEKGITLAGNVVDSKQQPVVGANIATGPDRYLSGRVVVSTDEKGEYRINNSKAGSMILTVSAHGFAPDLRTVSVSKEMPPADFQLTAGNLMRFRVVDKAGVPVPGVRISPDEWRGNRSLERTNQQTDEQGLWEWADAPADEIEYSFYKTGYMGLKKTLVASGEEQTVTLLPAVVVNGKVFDKETKQPIELFKYVEGVWWEPDYDSYVLQSMNVEVGKKGEFRFQMGSACEKFCLRVEAEGYRPLVSREIFPDEGEISLDFELVAGSGPKGVVATPDGAPAEGATVVLGSEEQAAQIWNGTLQDFSVTKMMTGVDGRYSLPIVNGDYMLVALHESGWAALKNPDGKDAAEVMLEPWSTVKGTVWQGDKPVSQEQVITYFDLSPGNPRPLQMWNYATVTDDKGNFEFKHVRSGEANLYRRFRFASTGDGWMTALSHKQRIQLLPGEIAEVKLGGEGRRVRGKLTVPEKNGDQIDWNFAVVQIYPMEKADSRLNTDAIYAAPIKSDGTFEIVDVLPDDYSLKVAVYAKDYRTSRLWEPIATLQQPCEVADESGDEIIDLGTFTVTTIKPQN